MNESTRRPPGNIYRHMLRGSAWAIAMRWLIRGIGLISVVILARLLTPEDFGVVAMGALAAGFVAGFAEIGVQMLLIREPTIDRAHCDTAWTIKILQGVFGGIVLILISPLAAKYFGDDRVIPVLAVMAFGSVAEGAQNIGMVLARRELDFAKDFRFNVYIRILSFFITITLALIFDSYWALVIGHVFASVLSIPLSFVMHPYRPRLSLERAGAYLRFAKSIIPLKVGKYLNEKADTLVVGGIAGTVQLGAYSVAADVSAMLTREILTPVGRGLMPNYTQLANEPERLAEAYRHVLATSAAIVLPFGLGLWAVADDFVRVLLGEQWLGAIPLVKWLAIYAMLVGLIHMLSGQILISQGLERYSAILMWLRLVVLVPAVVVAGHVGGVEAIAMSTVIAAGVIFPVAAHALTRALPIGWKGIAASFWRPCAAAGLMAIAVRWLAGHLDGGPVADLLVLGLSGGLIYLALSGLLWMLAGRPIGLERVIVQLLFRRLRRQ